LISVDDLSHQYPDGTQALSGINLAVDRGEAIVLLVHNASGKSTLLKALTRLIEPTGGQITVDSTAVTERRRANCAMCADGWARCSSRSTWSTRSAC
jgi:ABC-type multidrug transport system ATPase subunit